MESWALFQAKNQAKFFSIEFPPCPWSTTARTGPRRLPWRWARTHRSRWTRPRPHLCCNCSGPAKLRFEISSTRVRFFDSSHQHFAINSNFLSQESISVTHFLLQESGKLILVTKPTQLSQDERLALQTLCNIHTYTVILSSDRPNLAPARASANLFGRSFGRSFGQSSFSGDVTEAEAYLFTILDTFAVLFVQFFIFFW